MCKCVHRGLYAVERIIGFMWVQVPPGILTLTLEVLMVNERLNRLEARLEALEKELEVLKSGNVKEAPVAEVMPIVPEEEPFKKGSRFSSFKKD